MDTSYMDDIGKVPPRFLAEGCRSMTKSGLAFVYCV